MGKSQKVSECYKNPRPRGRPLKNVKVLTRTVTTPMDYIRRIDKLNLEGSNLAESWRIFWQNFEIFCTAAEINNKSDDVRIAVFLNAVGPEAVEIYNTFNLTEEQKKSYDDVTKAFANFCEPKQNETYESFVFHSRKQEAGETFDNFLMSLKKLIRNCGFKDQETRMLRDRIIVGTNDKQLQKRLLEVDKLDLKKTIEMARAAEVTNEQSQMLQGGLQSTSSNLNMVTKFTNQRAIFSEDQKNGPTEKAFKFAVHNINNNEAILPHTTLVYNVQYVPKDDSFHASKKVCTQVKMGVQAIFGPSDPVLGAHIHSICDALDIPHLESRLDLDTGIKEFSINLHPSQPLINTAFQDVMNYLNWTKVAVLFEKDYGLLKLRDLVRTPGLEVHIRQVESSSYGVILNELKNKEIQNLVIDTRPDNIPQLLRWILKLQMNEYKYHYLFTSFDIETFDLEDFKYNFVNITAFRLVDSKDVVIRDILKDMKIFNRANGYDDTTYYSSARFIESEPALMYDSVFVFAIGLQTLEQSHTLRLSNVSCADENPWDGGLSLINYINSVEWKGLTGPIQFKEGRRIEFKLDLVKLKQHSIVKVGEWSPQTRLNITDQSIFFDSGTMNVTLVVITILEIPYVMMHYEKNFTGNERFFGFCVDILDRVAHEVGFDYILDLVPDRKYGAKDPITGEWNGMVAQLMKHETPYVMLKSPKNVLRHRNGTIIESTSNERFEGFCIDLLKKIADLVGFEYKLELVPDGKYGVFDYDTKEWNGIVRQLMDKKADLAVGSMTINYARESVIDFTKPFMNLGISILFKVPTSAPTRLFSFMNPLAVDIWFYVLAAYVLVSITMYIVARFSPYEWHNPHPCDTENDIVENQFTIANSFWFTIGTLMQQGSDLNPKATSTRIVSGIWWFFTLIIISSYTANLAAFLTVERMITPIENADDLAGQTEISYGTLESGSTMTFFRDSMIETYKKMWRFMENKKPSVFTSTYEEGIKRVLEGNYAFLMESTMLDYIVQRDCNLTQIGGLLDTKGYGIATPMGSPWRDKISLAILELQEKGEIQMLYDKWWKNSGDTCIRQDKSKESKASALGVDNIGGVFVVLLCGLAIAVVVAITEFCHNSKKQTFVTTGLSGNDNRFGSQSNAPRQSLYSEMTEELCFALQCLGSRQRPALKRQCSKCIPATNTDNNRGLMIDVPHHRQQQEQQQLQSGTQRCQQQQNLTFQIRSKSSNDIHSPKSSINLAPTSEYHPSGSEAHPLNHPHHHHNQHQAQHQHYHRHLAANNADDDSPPISCIMSQYPRRSSLYQLRTQNKCISRSVPQNIHQNLDTSIT